MLAGFSKRNITPEPNVYLAGNGEYRSEGIHDPLFARALVFDDGAEWVALVSADLIGIERETTLAVRELLRTAHCGVPNQVLISCTHTHNGPHTRFGKNVFLPHRDEAYLARLSAAIAEAILDADHGKEEVSLTYGRGGGAENLNRRLTMPDGTTLAYGPGLLRERPDLTRNTPGVTDRELDAVQLLRRDGSVLATAVQYAAHPLTVGIFRNLISADYCGALVRGLEAAYAGNAIFVQGACGDLHPKGLFAGFDRMEELGRILCDEAVRVLSSGRPVANGPSLRFARQDLDLPTVISAGQPPSEKNRMWNLALFDKVYRTEMAAFALGPIAFVSAPGELLCEPGLQIKCNSPFEQTWILYNCNSYSSYIAHRRAYTEGGYEGERGQCLDMRACDLVLKTADELLRKVGQHDRGQM